jgi:hypothetical protein
MSARSIPTAPTGGVAVSDARQYVYTMMRVIPDLERGECINAGVVVFSRPWRFIGARVWLDEALLAALRGPVAVADVRERLDVLARIAAGDATAGPLAALDASERFHFLASHTSTVIQPSPVHSGVTTDPATTLDRLFARLVQRG